MSIERPTKNPHVIAWVEEMAKLCKPDNVFWCDGSEAERKSLTERAVAEKVLIPLDQKKWPGCYYHHSNQNDVARVEHLTFICTPTKERGRPHQQLDGADGGLPEARRPLRRRHEGPDDVRGALRHGPGDVSLRQGGLRDHRLHLRRPQHGDHDADGEGRPRPARRLATTSTAASTRSPTATPTAASSATSRRTTRSGRSARATAATRCSARSASRCASPATWRRTRAGWPSTC